MTTTPPSFGLIAEGPTDHELLLHLLAGYLDDPDVDLRPLQPRPDTDDPGGWVEVLRYLSGHDLEAAFEFVDHVIVQIDTDVCEEPGYGVSRRDDQGAERTVPELLHAVRERLIREIPAEVYQAYADRIIFAIAVESAECWLLPAAFANEPKKARKTKNCLTTLNQALRKHGFSIDQGAKQVRYFKKALRTLDRRRKLHLSGDRNPSLGAFIRQLDEHVSPASPDAHIDGDGADAALDD